MHPKSVILSAAAGVFASSLASAPSHAADHLNLEEGLPITVEDAYPIAYRGREIQGLFQYDRTDDDPEGDNLFTIDPRFEAGLFRNFQASIAVPYRVGSASDADSGDVDLDGLYNFNTESLWVPALALKGAVGVPFGDDSHGFETTIKGIATKTLGASWVRRQLHLNVSWTHRFDARNDERADRYAVVLGYSQPVRSDLYFVADVVREQRLQEDEEHNLAEAGLRFQVTPLLVLAAGVGAGFGSDSPDFKATLGFQYALSFFPMF